MYNMYTKYIYYKNIIMTTFNNNKNQLGCEQLTL